MNKNFVALLGDMLSEEQMKEFDEKLSASQEKAFCNFKNTESMLILGMAGTGKCLMKGTSVMMHSGIYKNVEDIKEGDKVMGDDSKPRIVKGIVSGISELYKITNEKGEEYCVNENHILSFKYSGKKYMKDCIAISAYVVYWFDNKTCDIKHKYFKYSIFTKFIIKDIAKIFLKSIFENLYVDIPILKYIGLEVYIKDNLLGYYANIDFDGEDIKNAYEIGYDAFKTPDIKKIKYSNKKSKMEFIAGMVDYSGEVDTRAKCIYISHEYPAVSDLQYICKCVGLDLIIDNNRMKIYGIGIENTPVKILKINFKTKIDNNFFKINVENIGPGLYYGFSVNKNKRFVIKDFIVTHNSHVIKTMKEYNQNENKKTMIMTATTGVASYNIGGVTIHSFMGIGTGEGEIGYIIKKIRRNADAIKRIQSIDILVIDEISMMSADIFEKLDYVCRNIRNDKRFFGGIQLLLCGDFLQNEAVFKNTDEKRLLIESDVFLNHFNRQKNNIVILKENFRQSNDSEFKNLLSRIRTGTLTNNDIEKLRTKCKNYKNEIEKLKTTPVHLVSTNKKAQEINDLNINKIKCDENDIKNYVYRITRNGVNNECLDFIEKDLVSQFKLRGMDNLTIKVGAKVMLVRNLCTESGLVNGSIGIVESFVKDFPYVKFNNGEKIVIEPTSWDIEIDNNVVSISQIPLILSYALTIHKVQSLTLDSAVMELSECFGNHMVYSALSRVKNFDNLLLKSFNHTKIKINTKIIKYLENIEL